MKKVKVIIPIVLAFILLGACNEKQTTNQTDDKKANQVEIPKDAEKITEEKMDIEATYFGLADNNTIIVEINEELISLPLRDLLHQDGLNFNNFKKNDKVIISYATERIQVKDGEIVSTYLTSIEKVASESEGMPTKEELDAKRETKKLEMFVEGMKELRTAYKYEGIHFDYTVYLLEGFSLQTDGKNKEMIVSEDYPEYYAEIALLDKNVDLIQLKEQLKNELKQFGKLYEPGTGIMGGFYDDSKIYLGASVGSIQSGGMVVRTAIVKEIHEKLFLIKLNTPVKEVSEGMEPSFVTMLETLK